MLEVGAEDVMAVLDAVDDGGQLAAHWSGAGCPQFVCLVTSFTCISAASGLQELAGTAAFVVQFPSLSKAHSRSDARNTSASAE